jgi:plasmid stabilization system protein ParE
MGFHSHGHRRPMSDLEAIADYIALDNPTRTVSFIREIREELPLVGQIPLLYQLRPEMGEDARLASSVATWSCSIASVRWSG